MGAAFIGNNIQTVASVSTDTYDRISSNRYCYFFSVSISAFVYFYTAIKVTSN